MSTDDTPQGTVQIDYVEFYSPHFSQTQTFFEQAFGWKHTAYGEHYRDISHAGIGAGLEDSDVKAPLIVLKSADLHAAKEKVIASGATITADIYAFPGGKRFEFREPGGTAMAVWCESDDS